jgi:hypothetical protein
MKDYNRLDVTLLTGNESFRGKLVSLVNNMGKAVAAIAAIVAALITFTDISLSELTLATFVPSLIAMLICSYVIYFSMEDAGEDLGKSSEEYRSALKKYTEERGKIGGNDIEPMRKFCNEYAKEELAFRKQSLMLTYGISEGEMNDFLTGKELPRKKRKLCRRICFLKPATLTPQLLLSRKRWHKRSELSNPEKSKVPMLLLKILPSTICMILTVSVMLNVKEDMTASDVINGILKLSALPVIGFKGYSAGYGYTKNSLSLWIETKANILEKFGIRKPEILMELRASGVADIDSAAALDNSGLLSEEDNSAVLPTEAQAESPEAPK